MQVILKEKVSGQGNAGQIINVSRGYARNFLFPNDKALAVNAESLAWLEAEKAVFAAQQVEEIALATARAAALQGVELMFPSTLKDGEALYGSIGVSEIVAALKEKNIEIDRSMVSLTDGNIRRLGVYQAKIQLHETVVVHCPVIVTLAADEG
jgi:large subunit ribosomal protein L9